MATLVLTFLLRGACWLYLSKDLMYPRNNCQASQSQAVLGGSGINPVVYSGGGRQKPVATSVSWVWCGWVE